MAIQKQREIIVILGKTGQGKSVWLRQFLKYRRRIFAFDPIRDFKSVYVDDISEMAEHVEYIQQFEKSENDPIPFNYAMSDPEHLDLLGNAAFLVGDCILCIEEAAFVFEMRQRAPQWLRDIIFLGRHRGVSLIVTAQRPVSIPIDLRSQATRLISFAQHEGSDVDWLRQYFGSKTYEIPDLEILECLDASNGGISRYKIEV